MTYTVSGGALNSTQTNQSKQADLVEQGERDALSERPAQQRVKLTTTNDQKHRQVRRPATPVAVQIDSSVQLVA